MATTERYTTVIELNSEQAKRQLDELRKKVESWKKLKDETIKANESKSFVAQINRELKAAEKELKKYDTEVSRTIDTLNNLVSSSIKQLEDAQKNLLRLSKEVPHDSPFYENLSGMLDKVTQELENIKATKAFEQMKQEASAAVSSAELLKEELAFVKQTADNAETASAKQLQMAARTAKKHKGQQQGRNRA
jgi:DNA repair exonuclease SbcCD ATPase subunit